MVSPKVRHVELIESLGIGIIVNHILKVKAADGTLDYLFSKCLELGTKFEDDSFPHEKQSLIEDWSDPAIK